MKTLLPTASRKRLEELLTFLGDRADDFKKCFDIESEWCWKYADIVLRGVNDKRKFPYREGHHIVPASFYGKRNRSIDKGNLISLPYGEHIYAHYCAAFCCVGRMKSKMARAFYPMYGISRHGERKMLPSEEELIASIPELEVNRIRSMDKSVSKLDDEGRTHYWEDPDAAKKDYYTRNRDKILAQQRKRLALNKEEINSRRRKRYVETRDIKCKQNRAWYEKNKDKVSEQGKLYYQKNREKRNIYNRQYHAEHKELLNQAHREYRKKNIEQCRERERAYCKAHKQERAARNKQWREANIDYVKNKSKQYYMENHDKILEYNKNYRELNRELLREKRHEYAASRRELLAKKQREYAKAKQASGYRYIRDPATGKRHWVFVGLPATPETPKSSTTAA